MKKVSIIIVNWNGKQYLEDCIKSLIEQNYNDCEIIVVDNNSTDGSENVVKKFKGVKLIKNSDNLGNAEGTNVGIRNARGDYIIRLDNDTKVNKDFVKELVKVADKNESIGMLAGKMIFYDNPDLINSTGLEVYDDGSVVDKNIKKKNNGFDEVEEIFAPCGGSAFYKKEALEKIKEIDGDYFDSDFKFYYEDADVGFRIRHLGYQCFYVPNAVAFHKVNASTKKVKDLRIYYGIRNKVFFIIKNYPKRVILGSIVKIILKQILSTFYYLLKGKFIVIKARVDILRGFGLMMNKRKRINPDNSKFNFPLKKNSLFNPLFN